MFIKVEFEAGSTAPSGAAPSRWRVGIRMAFRALALGLAVAIVVAACHDVSKAWDVWMYHLPFAGRIAGLVDPNTYVFGLANRQRFEGFPLLAEALQGLAWRLTGRPECANLVSVAALGMVVVFMKRRFGVPASLSLVAFLAIPLVQIHVTAAYVDLPANACATLLALVTYQALVAKEPPNTRELGIAAVLAVATSNMKFQLVPVVLGCAVVLLVRSLRNDDRRLARLGVIALALPFVFATPIKNVILHGNPVWPVEIHVPGVHIPFAETAYASSPRWLEHVPRPVRFLCSVLEIGARPIAEGHRWSIDQWTPPDEPGYRMGGFFGAFVLVNLVALAFAAYRRRSRENVVAIAFFAGLSALVSVLPQSHELRYYLVWMLTLVALNLVVWSRERPLTVGWVGAAALAVVAWSTGGTYLVPSGDSFATLLATHVDRARLEAIAPGERVCIDRQPWTFLWSPQFHARASYVVQEAEDPSACNGARPLDEATGVPR